MAMKNRRFSADNIAFGVGGGLLQKLNRDTQRFAFKCSAVRVNGSWRDVYKSPVTDPGKHSKAGRLKLVRYSEELVTCSQEVSLDDLLVEVFRNGELMSETTFDEVRERARLE